MVNQNTAYDLSFYEAEEERQVARKQTKESRLIKAERRYSITKKIADIVSVAFDSCNCDQCRNYRHNG